MTRAIITDVEGTTTAIHFVEQILFPYSRQHLPALLKQQQPAIQDILNELREEIGQPTASIEQLTSLLLQCIDEDRKFPALKKLQGIIWRNGYLNGEFTGHLYQDVLPAFRRWKAQGISVYIYSSGSIASQQLLFGYSDHGDVTQYLSGYFDTAIGHKRDSHSYHHIAGTINLPPSQLLFLSDICQELDAAQAAGWQTLQLSRNAIDRQSHHRQVTSFDEIAGDKK